MSRFSRLLLMWIACGMALAFMVPAVAAPTLTFKFTEIKIPGATQVNAFGISESGVVVGEYLDSIGLPHGFTLQGNTVTKVDDPKGLGTFCQGISPDGSTIVGYYIKSTGKNFGFLLKGNTFTDVLGPKGATISFAFGVKTATGINNSGNIVVYWDDPSGNFESSLYNGKTYKSINVKGAVNSFAQGINTNGDIVYWWANTTGIHGALRQAGKYSKFDDPNGVGTTYGFGLNSHRQIVGSYSVAGIFHGYEATY